MPDKRPSPLPTEVFAYDLKRDRYLCPTGQALTRQGVVGTEKGLPITIYLARPERCESCPLKEACCPNAKARSIRGLDGGHTAAATRHQVDRHRCRQA
jgi:hypothetical protein